MLRTGPTRVKIAMKSSWHRLLTVMARLDRATRSGTVGSRPPAVVIPIVAATLELTASGSIVPDRVARSTRAMTRKGRWHSACLALPKWMGSCPGMTGKQQSTLRSRSCVNGFTLIELAVVLAIMGLMLALVVTRGPMRGPALQTRAAAAQIAQGLRAARARAIAQ